MAYDFDTKCGECTSCCNVHVIGRVSTEWFLQCNEEEIKRIGAENFNGDKMKIKENGDCIFLEKGCTIQDIKPEACRKFGQQFPCLFYPERSKRA